MNLTRAALDAAVKYPWTLAEADQHPKGERSKKFCVYPDDEPVFRWLKIGAPQAAKPMECQIMDLSDDVAYSVHDVEDSIATGAFDPIVLADPKMLDHIIEQTRAWYGAKWDADKLLAAFMRLRREHLFPAHFNGSRESLAQLKNITSDLIGRFCWSVETATRDTYGPGPLTRYSANIVIPEDTNYEIVALKASPCTSSWRLASASHSIRRSSRSYRIWSMCLWPIRRSHPTLWKASSWPIGMNPPMTTNACASPSIRSRA